MIKRLFTYIGIIVTIIVVLLVSIPVILALLGVAVPVILSLIAIAALFVLILVAIIGITALILFWRMRHMMKQNQSFDFNHNDQHYSFYFNDQTSYSKHRKDVTQESEDD